MSSTRQSIINAMLHSWPSASTQWKAGRLPADGKLRVALWIKQRRTPSVDATEIIIILDEHFTGQPAQQTAAAEPAKQQQHIQMDYSNTPVATPTFVFGTDVATMNENQCLQAIKAAKASIKELTEVGVESAYITEKVTGLNNAITVLLKRLDGFATAA